MDHLDAKLVRLAYKPRRRKALAQNVAIALASLLVALALAYAALGLPDSAERDATRSGEKWCERLQDEGVLFESFDECVAEVRDRQLGR